MKGMLAGCRVEITVPFAAGLAFLLLADSTGAVACGILAAALHEGGHLLMLRLQKRRVCGLRLTIFGAQIRAHTAQSHYSKDAALFLAGPAANLLALVVCSILPVPALAMFRTANALLGFVNLLPVGPLDGGQALFCLLQMHFSARRARQIVQVVSFVVLLPLAAAGFLLLFRSRWNFTLLVMAVYLLFLLLLKPDRA